jgi:apolipoprotein N-acyltransferase
VHAGAELLINLSNDSWLGVAKYSEPAFDMVALRAIEQRRWIIRASTAGPSALIDPVGRVTRRTDLFTASTIAGTVQARSDVTLYSRLGDAFAWACAVAACVGAGTGYRRSRKHLLTRRHPPTCDPRPVPDGKSHQRHRGMIGVDAASRRQPPSLT